MTLRRYDENPFDLVKASDFSATEILEYWVDMAADRGGLVDILKPKLLMPMLLLGGKGSGKTHLMRYCSAPVQSARYEGNLCQAISKEGYLGIYVPAEGLNSQKFAGKGQDDELWLAVFSMYFELWLVTSLLSVVQQCTKLSELGELDEGKLIDGIAALFDKDVKNEFVDLSSLIDYLTIVRKNIDYAANNVAITRKRPEIEIIFSSGRLVYGIPKVIASVCPFFSETVFVYLVDEAENFTNLQQRFLNSLVRYRTGNSTIKIGARLYGVRTYDTLGSGEPIKRGSEYERVELDNFLRANKPDYEIFIRKLVSKRLQQAGLPAATGSGEELAACFEELDTAHFFQQPLLNILREREKKGAERPYFKRLRGYLKQFVDPSEKHSDAIIDGLRSNKNPLLEKINTLLLYRDWERDPVKLLDASKKIQLQCASFLTGDSHGASYADVVKHFDSDMLAQFYRDCGVNIPYCGLGTLVHLSQGIPRNLLGILKQIYRRSLFAGERPFAGGKISVASQSSGVLDSAAWFWEDAQPDSFGPEVRQSIEALALLFRTIRFSDRPAECDLCTFSVDEEKLSENSRNVLRTCENWSYLIRIPGGAKNKNSKEVDEKYQFGPMLAPRWGISVHRRGNLELKPELAEAIFDIEKRQKLPDFFRERVGSMFIENVTATKSAQKSLF